MLLEWKILLLLHEKLGNKISKEHIQVTASVAYIEKKFLSSISYFFQVFRILFFSFLKTKLYSYLIRSVGQPTI